MHEHVQILGAPKHSSYIEFLSLNDLHAPLTLLSLDPFKVHLTLLLDFLDLYLTLNSIFNH